ncbi:uncharacterized protein LOC125237669 [Leguminivora glycinivorella]|uniref:uncharacterized protein LOC125237669 n=1 Tax=Leguminivora glycinivorella TaxID=1035111 RepID=UPI00200F5184|nr:uncharacterized protein LOC125237669 [Leguminivora glycinivorella]
MDGVRRSDGLDGLTRADDNAKKPDPTKRFMDALKGFQRNFDYNHPDLTDNEDLEESMQLRRDLVSYLHESHDGGRRSGRSDQSEIDREVLIHHAVPIVMTVEGIMQLPKNYNDNE